MRDIPSGGAYAHVGSSCAFDFVFELLLFVFVAVIFDGRELELEEESESESDMAWFWMPRQKRRESSDVSARSKKVRGLFRKSRAAASGEPGALPLEVCCTLAAL